MNRAIACWSTALAMTGLSLGAQAPTPATPPVQTPVVAPAAPVSVTGCLRAWSDGGTEPAATASESRTAGLVRFTLTQIEGTKASPAADDPSRTEELRLLLEPTGAIDLAAHVNTKVTVTGTLPAADDDSRAIGTSGQQPGTGADPKLQKPREAHAYRNMSVTAVMTSAKSCDKS